MIFTQGAQGAQGASERAAIIGQSLREGEYQVQRIIEQRQNRQAWIFLVMHTTLMIPLALKQLPADQPLAENTLTQLDALLYAEDSMVPTITPLHRAQEDNFPALDGSAANQFAREALLLARLRHPAIPTLYDYFFEDGYWYLVMDYIPGHTLTTYLQQYGHISALEALNCTIQICDILDYLHTQTPAIILWNLTTDSIRVTPEGVLMLANFDFAAQSQAVEEDAADVKTTNGHIHRPGDTEMEMIAYMPAQQDARRNRDTLADVYSLGIILREMLYGKKPGQADSEDAEASQLRDEARKDQSQQRSQDLQDPQTHHAPHISTYLKSLVRLATRTEPMDRFQSTQAFSLALLRAYQIEEQRAFQEHLVQLNDQTRPAEQSGGEPAHRGQKGVERATQGDESSGADGQDKKGWEREDTPPITLSRTLELEQRQLTRAALQRVRQERQQYEQIEIQLASVDEGLEQRSNVSLPQISPQAIAHAEAPTVAIPVTRRLQDIIRVNFVLALVLCIVLVSLLIYVRVAQPLENSIHFLIQGPISSTNGSGDLQNSQSTPGTQGMQNQQGANGGLADNYWQALPSLPGAEADNATVYVELQGRAYIYMSGGYHGSPPTAYDRSLYRYDIRAAHWETVSSGHFPGMVNNAADVDEQGHIFFTGGYSSDTYTVSSQLYVYDPGTSFLKKITAPAQMPVGFGGSIFADRQGHLYITQGFMHPGDPHAQAGTGWYRYDIGTAQWHQLATLPVGLGYTFTASDNNGGILLMGGATDAGQHDPTNKIYRYDIASDSWTQAIDNLPQAISGAAGCQAWPGQLVIVGGYDPAHDTGTQSTWLLDLHTLKWRSLVDLTIGGSVLGAAACDGKGHVFLERGTNNPRIPTSDYWEMVVAPGIKIDNP